MKTDSIITFRKNFKEGDPSNLVDFLESHTKLSKTTIKKLLSNGAVWVRKFNSSKRLRTRRATTELNLESHVELYYDPKFLNLEIPESREVYSQKEWGLWFKPSGVLSQGTDFGDHSSILRQVEKIKGKSFLVHRLDREASGLILMAYTQKAASLFSQMWTKDQVQKFYKVEVLGDLKNKFPNLGEVNLPLDGKSALTTFKVLSSNAQTSILLVQIHTGRLHQIRRHFEMIGHPVMGDPKYGRGNKNEQGLRLMAFQLIFKDPFQGKEVNFELKDVVF